MNQTIKSSLYLDFQDASKGHAEVPVIVLTEDSLEGLLEQRGIEGVSHHYVPPEARHNESLRFS